MTKIYDQHRAAFANVSAYIVMKDGERVATVAFKFPKDGAGRVYAYVHWIGVEMVRGMAAGGGYDKQTAAVNDAVRKIKIPGNWSETVSQDPRHSFIAEFIDSTRKDEGPTWNDHLRKAGFTVIQAV